VNESRVPLVLNVDDVIQNNFLLADYMTIPKFRKQLEQATTQDIRKVMNYFQDESNVRNFASIFKSGLYKEYHNSKNRNTSYDIAIEAAKEITETGIFFTFYEAVYNLAYNIRKQDQAVEEFVNAINQIHISARLEDLMKRMDNNRDDTEK
jgi:hypothetical protein